jgi:hypothetical protein
VERAGGAASLIPIAHMAAVCDAATEFQSDWGKIHFLREETISQHAAFEAVVRGENETLSPDILALPFLPRDEARPRRGPCLISVAGCESLAEPLTGAVCVQSVGSKAWFT